MMAQPGARSDPIVDHRTGSSRPTGHRPIRVQRESAKSATSRRRRPWPDIRFRLCSTRHTGSLAFRKSTFNARAQTQSPAPENPPTVAQTASEGSSVPVASRIRGTHRP